MTKQTEIEKVKKATETIVELVKAIYKTLISFIPEKYRKYTCVVLIGLLWNRFGIIGGLMAIGALVFILLR